jgi:hypothetical protein
MGFLLVPQVWTSSMRSGPLNLGLSIFCYFAFLSVVVGGAIVGTRAVLATVPQPHFLLPENRIPTSAHGKGVPTQATVQLKPYRQGPAPDVTWTTSLGRSYVVSTRPLDAGIRAQAPQRSRSRPLEPRRGWQD